MNEWFTLNSKAIRAWLEKDDRKQSFLVKRLDVSKATVARMLNEDHVPEDKKVVETLAQLMGVEVQTLLIPKAKAG